MKHFILFVIVAMIYFKHWFQIFGSPKNGLREQNFNSRYLQFMTFNL